VKGMSNGHNFVAYGRVKVVLLVRLSSWVLASKIQCAQSNSIFVFFMPRTWHRWKVISQ
jgi:hypothetical protein